MPPPDAATEAERLEALIRTTMAAHAALPDRGFDSARDRQRLRNRIDDLLDELASTK